MKKMSFLAVLLATSACAQSKPAEPAAPQAPEIKFTERTQQKFPAPDRPVASIVTNHSGPEDERDAQNEAGQTMDLLPLKPGVVVADIGAGEGYYTVRLAKRLGDTGQIIATDVMPDYLDGLKARVAKENLTNVSFILGGYDDPKLPPSSADAVLMVRMYHEIEQPYAFLWRLHDALKPGGVIAISEREYATERHGTPKDLLICELEAVGFEQISVTDLVKPKGQSRTREMGYVALFKATRRPQPEEIIPCADDK